MPRNHDASHRLPLRSGLRVLTRMAWLPAALIALPALHLALEAEAFDLLQIVACVVLAAQVSLIAIVNWTLLRLLARRNSVPILDEDVPASEPAAQQPELTVVAVEWRRPFRARLASFLGIEQSQLSPASERNRSRMPFWTSLTWLVPRRPKSAAMIRHLLARVQQRRGA